MVIEPHLIRFILAVHWHTMRCSATIISLRPARPTQPEYAYNITYIKPKTTRLHATICYEFQRSGRKPSTFTPHCIYDGVQCACCASLSQFFTGWWAIRCCSQIFIKNLYTKLFPDNRTAFYFKYIQTPVPYNAYYMTKLNVKYSL